jgi:hypothetical protein
MHKLSHGIVFSLLITACDTGNKYISESDFEDYEYVDTAETDTGDTEDSDTDDTDDTDTQDTQEPEICKNDYHPIHQTGWSKTFTATYEGETATAIEEGIGATDWNGETVYAYRDAMILQGTDSLGTPIPIDLGWDMTVYVACDYNGQEGLFMLGWSGSFSECQFCIYNSFDPTNPWLIPPTEYTIDSTLDPFRRYLGPEFAVGAEGSWAYDYQLNINAVDSTGAPQNQTEQVTGSYLDAGFQQITLFEGTTQSQTVTAYKVINTVTETDQFGNPTESYIEQYWVKGLGMVRENFLDAEQNITLSKELNTVTGLTVIQ